LGQMETKIFFAGGLDTMLRNLFVGQISKQLLG